MTNTCKFNVKNSINKDQKVLEIKSLKMIKNTAGKFKSWKFRGLVRYK